MAESYERAHELPEEATDAEVADESEEVSPTDVFEHLARIRAGISEGVVTLW